MQNSSRVDALGHAYKGSQRQIQDYVNEHEDYLNCAIATTLGDSFKGEIEWVSPLQNQRYAEYYDGAFLEELGYKNLVSAQREFWPPGGPRWDALARGCEKQVFLVEAKSYPQEIFGECKAQDPTSLALIAKSLRDTAMWLHINNGYPPSSWMKPLYQSANRLAHLCFLRRNGIDAFLLNVCIVNDGHNTPGSKTSTTLSEWKKELAGIKQNLGITEEACPYLRDVFLPALPYKPNSAITLP